MFKRIFVIRRGHRLGRRCVRVRAGQDGVQDVGGRPRRSRAEARRATSSSQRQRSPTRAGSTSRLPPEDVWPWLVQMGYGRAGWYSYDELDMDRPSAERIVPELQEIKVGDVVPDPSRGRLRGEDRGARQGARALLRSGTGRRPRLRPPREDLGTASANVRATGAYLDASMPGDFQASWTFVLEPTSGGTTRLIERFRGRMEPVDGRPAPPAIAGKALVFGLFVMVRRQMLGIRDRAEGRPIRHAPWREFALAARAKAMEAAASAKARAEASVAPPTPAAPTGVTAAATPA